jgi:L-2-hydroxycarboxylate dehydrogenase (NAD+)
MDLAISKAKEFGIGIVVARNSTHYGMAGFYSMIALKENLIVKKTVDKVKLI